MKKCWYEITFIRGCRPWIFKRWIQGWKWFEAIDEALWQGIIKKTGIPIWFRKMKGEPDSYSEYPSPCTIKKTLGAK